MYDDEYGPEESDTGEVYHCKRCGRETTTIYDQKFCKDCFKQPMKEAERDGYEFDDEDYRFITFVATYAGTSITLDLQEEEHDPRITLQASSPNLSASVELKLFESDIQQLIPLYSDKRLNVSLKSLENKSIAQEVEQLSIKYIKDCLGKTPQSMRLELIEIVSIGFPNP